MNNTHSPTGPSRVFSKEIAAQARRIELRTRGLVESLFSGEYHSVFKGRGLEFSDVREYQPGDDVRAIDWNVTARRGSRQIRDEGPLVTTAAAAASPLRKGLAPVAHRRAKLIPSRLPSARVDS